MIPYDRFNEQLIRYSITILFSVTHCRCICIYAITANAKTTFLLVCHFSKCADEKERREYYCPSMSVYLVSSNIYSVASAISISGLGDYIATSGCGHCPNHLGFRPWLVQGKCPHMILTTIIFQSSCID